MQEAHQASRLVNEKLTKTIEEGKNNEPTLSYCFNEGVATIKLSLKTMADFSNRIFYDSQHRGSHIILLNLLPININLQLQLNL